VSGDHLRVSTRPSRDRRPGDARRRWSTCTVALVVAGPHSDQHRAEEDEKCCYGDKTETGAAPGSI
jgi:hypothetical protein